MSNAVGEADMISRNVTDEITVGAMPVTRLS
ncbi:hypothetical protein BH20ACT14_BH20ACT14_03480 [soil metagenome]